MFKDFDCCLLCPRKCAVNRNKGDLGVCMAPNKIVIAKYYLHKWEEPCLTGTNGSGTIFFSYCNLKCVYCQNYQISIDNYGVLIEIDDFASICLELQRKGATNINLVTPTHFIPLIIEGIKIAKKRGLVIPIVYNSSGYESVDTLKKLEGIIDIYLPDFKYYSNVSGEKYSKCPNYVNVTKEAIKEMVRQKKECVFDDNGNLLSGVIVRHLILPGLEDESKKIIQELYEQFHDKIYFSIMNQYTPTKNCHGILEHKISNKNYTEIIDYAWDLGIRQAFVQEEGTQSESFIPSFSIDEVINGLKFNDHLGQR